MEHLNINIQTFHKRRYILNIIILRPYENMTEKKPMLVFNELIKTKIYYRILFAHKMKMNWQTLDMVVGISQEGSSIASD